MRGIRAFGKNEGSLNHCGDFRLLFSPVLPRLEDAVSFRPKLTFSPLYASDAPENWEEILDELSVELERLDLRTAVEKKKQVEPYYGPGFFSKFATYIVDDWNEILCFKPPFPEYAWIFDKVFGGEKPRGFEHHHYAPLRKQFQSLGFYAYFRNVDASFWECYAPDDGFVLELRKHLIAWNIDFEDLEFDQDYPFGGLKKERRFSGVHKIWPPD